MVPSKKIRDTLTDILSAAGKQGIHQSLLEKTTGYSKSYLSEILASMETDGAIVRKPEVGRNNRIWISTNYPGEVEGLLKIGILKSTEYYYHLIALRKVAEYGNLKISIKLFDRASDVVTEVVEGVLDVGFAPTVSVVLSSDASQISVISEVASGGAFIFENENSKSIKLASSELSSMSLLSSSLISKREDLAVEYFRDPAEVLNRFLSGKVRYLTIWEPFATLIPESSSIRKILSYTDSLNGMPCCLLICNRRERKSRDELFLRLKDEIRNAIEHPDESIAKQTLGDLCKLLKLPQDIVLRSLNSYKFKHDCSKDDLIQIVHNIGISVSASLIDQMVS